MNHISLRHGRTWNTKETLVKQVKSWLFFFNLNILLSSVDVIPTSLMFALQKLSYQINK